MRYKTVLSLRPSLHGVLMQPREKVAKRCAKTCVFYPIAQNFLLVGPYYNFSATIASSHSTYHLRAVASLKVLATAAMKIYASNCGKVAYRRLGNARRAALGAILPDNCHPSSYNVAV